MELKILSLALLAISVSSFGQQSKLRFPTTLDNARDSVITMPFRLPADYELSDSAFPVAPEKWSQWIDTLLGLSFLCPEPYASTRDTRAFWLWRPAGDTVLTLYFGAGATVQIYKSSRSFPEIAFAEGFQQFQNDTSDLYPVSDFDPLPDEIVDTNWVLRGVSGLTSPAHVLVGTQWKGLCSVTDTRAAWPEQMTTYIADVFVALLVYASPNGHNIVFLYRVDPDDREDEPGHRQPRLLSEAAFYRLIASVTRREMH